MRFLSRTGWLAALFAVQVTMLAALLAWSASVRGEIRMELEARLPEPDPGIHLPAGDSLETASILGGSEFLGIELPTPFRRHLSYLNGQMFWFLLKREPSAGAPLLGLIQKIPTELEDSGRLQEGLRDGVLSFLYDVGGHRDLARQNWSATVVRELQALPLLPWNKKLDFVVLSSLADTSVGGLGFIADLNPEILLIMPDHDPARLEELRLFRRRPNAVILPVGTHPLLPGLWAQVLEAPAGSGHPAELNLLVEGRDGRLALFSGSSLNRPIDSLRQARRSTGREILRYVGSTGYTVGTQTSALQDEVRVLRQEFPELVLIPNGDTSLVAHGLLEALLGAHYRPGSLGTRVEL